MTKDEYLSSADIYWQPGILFEYDEQESTQVIEIKYSFLPFSGHWQYKRRYFTPSEFTELSHQDLLRILIHLVEQMALEFPKDHPTISSLEEAAKL